MEARADLVLAFVTLAEICVSKGGVLRTWMGKVKTAKKRRIGVSEKSGLFFGV